MPSTFEKTQATGALSSIRMGKETDWGVARPASTIRQLNLLPGETIDQNIALYRSNAMIPSRARSTGSVRGSVRPGGSIPFELAHKGVSQLFWHLLGGSVSVDNGSAAPNHVHTIVGSPSLPTGFSVEKKFTDLASVQYVAILGCRVNSCDINFNIDSITAGSFDVMGREFTSPSGTSIFGGSPTVIDESVDPFTSVEIAIYEAGSATQLGTARSLQMRIANNMYGDNFVLGSNKRVNLKPGTRDVTFNGSFLFSDFYLYNKAINGTDTSIHIIATHGAYSFAFLLDRVNLLPNNASPKISTPGPIDIALGGECLASTDGNTPDIEVQITTSEAAIDD